MPSKVIIIVIEFMFLGINIFWALLRAHFNPRLTARAKMSLSRAQNIYIPVNINSIVLMYAGKVDSKPQSRPLSGSRHFGFEMRLDGQKQSTRNKLCILKTAHTLFMPF